jgi:hypothetical protein
MVLNFKVLAFASLVLSSVSTVHASVEFDEGYFTVGEVELSMVSTDELNQEVSETVYSKRIHTDTTPAEVKPIDLDRVGKVISLGRDLVALGEDVYKLVIKGKPTNVTKYAPISVIPKENNEPVDVMSTEDWQMPRKQSFSVVYKNLWNVKIVQFRYSVIYSYGGTYNGKGAYLTAVQIIPESVSTLFGFDFTATMKLGGIQNMAKRDDPVAGATLLLEYTVNSFMKASTQVATIFVDGRGQFKHY